MFLSPCHFSETTSQLWLVAILANKANINTILPIGWYRFSIDISDWHSNYIQVVHYFSAVYCSYVCNIMFTNVLLPQTQFNLPSHCSGEPSLQNALELAISSLKMLPSHASREVLIILGSLTTCDPGDINQTVMVSDPVCSWAVNKLIPS